MQIDNKRNFILGDEWIYYKIYSGRSTAEDLLTNTIIKLSDYFLNHKIIDKWFFIRYQDPNPHIRYRLHISDINQIYVLIQMINNELNSYKELIWNVSLDTYHQEIERYGRNTIDLSESIFFYDSVMIVTFLNILTEVDSKEEYRWLYSLKIIDSCLDRFGLSLIQKKEFVKNYTISLKKEYIISKDSNKKLSLKYRKNKSTIEKVLKSEVGNDFEKKILVIIMENKRNLSSVIDKIINIKEKKELEVQFYFLIVSYIHMNIIRLFKSKQRMNEMVCYDFLYRFYNSEIAKTH